MTHHSSLFIHHSSLPFWYPPILTYHRVHPAAAADTPTLTPQQFDRQMTRLAQRWRPIPLATLITWLEGQGPLPRRAVAVTFDDGEESLAAHAGPILRRHRIPATVFMIADNIGRPGFLTEEQLRRLRGEGMTIGSHTLRHAYLPSLPADQARHELAESKRRLEQRSGGPVEFLSYPGGGYTPDVAQAARETGYRAACTTNRGTQRAPDRWALRRITMHASAISAAGIWLRCSGYYTTWKRLRAPV